MASSNKAMRTVHINHHFTFSIWTFSYLYFSSLSHQSISLTSGVFNGGLTAPPMNAARYLPQSRFCSLLKEHIRPGRRMHFSASICDAIQSGNQRKLDTKHLRRGLTQPLRLYTFCNWDGTVHDTFYNILISHNCPICFINAGVYIQFVMAI